MTSKPRRVMREIMRMRGYERVASEDPAIELYRNGRYDKIFVVYMDGALNKPQANELVTRVPDAARVIVLCVKASHHAVAQLAKHVHLETFHYSECMYNKLTAAKVPRMRLLRDDAAWPPARRAALPVISTADPVLKFLGPRRGDVVEIKYLDPFRAVAHRRVE